MNPLVTIVDCEQRSEAWFKSRLGRLTGSDADKMLANGKGNEESVQRRDLRTRLALERIAGRPVEDSYSNRAMERGIEKEPVSLDAYQIVSGRMLHTCGFLSHNELMTGCSLDAYVGAEMEGLVEFKNPDKSAIHLGYLRKVQDLRRLNAPLIGAIPKGYLDQLIHNLYVSGAEWADWVSHDDRFPEATRLLVIRVRREDVDLTAHDKAVRKFLTEVDREQQSILELGAVAA